MKLYDHQQQLLDEDPSRCGIWWGTGSGKTKMALLLAQGRTLVVAPKTIVEDGTWGREFIETGGKEIKVLSKETFRRDHASLPMYDTVILDEAHTFAGATPALRYRKGKPVPKTSLLFEAAAAYLAAKPPKRLYLLTATPIRSPMSVWALAQLLGHFWDFYKFRDAFYIRLNMPGREVWQPRKDSFTKDRLAKAVQKLGSVWKLSDGFDVPEQTDITKACLLTAGQKALIRDLPLEYPNPLVLIGKRHQAEQGESKCEAVSDLQAEFGKVIVYCRYIEQIRQMEEYFKTQKITTLTLTGTTRERRSFMQSAERMEEGVAIIQSSISAGYELPSFSCMVFASCSWSWVDYVQAKGRILRANALKKNLYVHLVSGEVDKAVLAALGEKKDFSERVFTTT